MTQTVQDASQFKDFLEQEIQSSWNIRLERYRNKSDEISKDISSLKEKISGAFHQEFREIMANLKEEKELHEVNNRLTTQYLQQLENQLPVSNITVFRQEKQKVIKTLDDTFKTILVEFKNAMVQMDEGTRVKIRNIEDDYEKNMQQLLRDFTFLPEDFLEQRHTKLVNEGLVKLEQRCSAAPAYKQEEYRNLLAINLKHKLQIFQSQNNNRQEEAKQQVMQQLQPIKQEFFNLLNSEFPSEERLLHLVDDYGLRCYEALYRQTTVKIPDPKAFQRLYGEEVHGILQEAVKEHIELEPTETELKHSLDRAEFEYSRLMNEKLNTQKHIDPNELLKLHKETLEQVWNVVKQVARMTKKSQQRIEATIQMKFLEYKDRNNLKIANLKDIAIGIDLGTTFSCGAVYKEGQVVMIPNLNMSDKFVTPSYVLYEQDGEIVVGESAKSQSYIHPQNAIFDAKRLIGRKFEDPVTQKDIQNWPFKVVRDTTDTNQPKVEVHGKQYFPEQISAQVLRKLKVDAEAFLGTSVSKAVITVPAYFNEAQKLSTKNAGAIAGLQVLRIISEPTSAAIAYSLGYSAEERNVLVYDLGGGTFDVSVLVMSNAKIEVKATGGNNHLGGEDFDSNMVDFCIQAFQNQHNLSIREGEPEVVSNRLKRIRVRCEAQKLYLSEGTTCRVIVDRIHGDLNLDVEIRRDQFEEMNKALFQETITIVEAALKDAKLAKKAIQDILLVGGSIRIPKVQQLLKNYFNGKNLTMTQNPDEVVARGAAICAALKNVQLSDVIPLSLGIETVGEKFSSIIPKNTAVPVEKTQKYVTPADNMTELKIKVYEGEDTKIQANSLLGSFTITGIPPKKAGQEPIDVTMSCDIEGILHVKAVIRSTGTSNEINIDRGGMSEEQVRDNTK